MQIGLLGPFEVLLGQRVVTPSAPKLRQVLALFSVTANTIVRNELIIEELWEDNPPVSVTTTLQTYIYQLRKLLRPEGAERSSVVPELSTSFGGYRLTIPPSALDSHQFEELSECGRAELEAGNLSEAARMLTDSLKLWRGPALVDISTGSILRAEALRLEELHRSTLERRIEADLRLGRHHELLGELTGLVAAQPTHEGFQRSLMLALHRAGRRSEALRVYHRAREALADELGLDPSAELQRVQRAVLASDRSLDLPGPVPGGWAGTRPQQPPFHLPSKPGELVNRYHELEKVLDVLSAGDRATPPVVVVTGPPGSGTTALGVQAAHRMRGTYPEGQLWYRMLGQNGTRADPGDVLSVFLRGLGVPEARLPSDTHDRCMLFRTCTADRRVLVVLDDVTSADQLRLLLPSGDGCGVLVTGRRGLYSSAITGNVHLAPLGIDGSLRLLGSVLGTSRILRDEESARQLAERCDGLPVALRAAATKLQLRAHWQVGRFLRWLRETSTQAVTDADPLGMRDSVERTCLALPEEARIAFRALVRADGELSVPGAAALLRTGERTAEALIEELVEANLVAVTVDRDRVDGYRYRFLRVIREAGRQMSDDVQAPQVPHQQNSLSAPDDLASLAWP